MPKVGATFFAGHLDTFHAVAVVGNHFQIFFTPGPGETWPATAGIKFVCGAEQRRIATSAFKDPLVLAVVVDARERAFCSLAAGYVELLGCQLCLPFCIGLFSFVTHARFSLRYKCVLLRFAWRREIPLQ